MLCKQCKKTELSEKQIKKKNTYCSKSCASSVRKWTILQKKRQSGLMKEVYKNSDGFTIEHKRNISKTHSTPEYIEKHVRPFTLAGQKITESSIEVKVKTFLLDNNIRFEKFKRVGKYFPDFILKKTKAIIECDGDYWHGTPEAKRKDNAKDNFYKSLGYSVLRLKEKDINQNFNNCEQRIFNIA